MNKIANKSHEALARKLHRRSFIEKQRVEERLFADGKISTKPQPLSEEMIAAEWSARPQMQALWLGLAEEATNHLRNL